MLIYQIRLPKKQDAEAFVKFMQEEYFPAIRKGQTRVGQVIDLTLLQVEPEGRTTGCEFFWHVGWSGLAMGDVRNNNQAVARKLESFKARIKRIGSYTEVATWPEASAA
ncbi:MAG: hypothetical protein ABI977_24380 [Acidobacteriota bacterium]